MNLANLLKCMIISHSICLSCYFSTKIWLAEIRVDPNTNHVGHLKLTNDAFVGRIERYVGRAI